MSSSKTSNVSIAVFTFLTAFSAMNSFLVYEEETPTESIKNIDDLVHQLNAVVGVSGDKMDSESVAGLLQQYAGNDWQNHVKIDSSVAYSRSLVHVNEHFAVLVMTWNEDSCSKIHSHGGSQCSLKVLQGDGIKEELYPFQGSENFEMIREGAGTVGSIGYINDDLGSHRICNRSAEKVGVSLHIYYPPYQTCSVMDENTGEKKAVDISFSTQK